MPVVAVVVTVVVEAAGGRGGGRNFSASDAGRIALMISGQTARGQTLTPNSLSPFTETYSGRRYFRGQGLDDGGGGILDIFMHGRSLQTIVI